MRYSSTVGRILTLMAVLALLGIALTGCPEERPQETTVIPPADIGGDAEPGEDYATPTGDAEEVLPEQEIPEDAIEVGLTEWEIDMPDTLAAGMTSFLVNNKGSEVHSFEIEGQGIEEELENYLEAGDHAVLKVNLEPGEYRAYCPVGDHAEQGMDKTVTVTE